MTCHELAERIAAQQPQLTSVDVARLCLLILSHCEQPGELADQSALMRHWHDASFRLEAASDQHAAVADELDALGRTGWSRPGTQQQVGVLLRAVKVQSQVLELYTGQPTPA